MNCKDTQDLIAGYVADDIPQALATEVTKHIIDCLVCHYWYQEVLELYDVWQDTRPVPGLNLATPVLRQIADYTRNTVQHEEYVPTVLETSSSMHALPHLKPQRNLRSTALVHYGVAASIAIALFQFGAFQRLGALATHGMVLSNAIKDLFGLLSNHA